MVGRLDFKLPTTVLGKLNFYHFGYLYLLNISQLGLPYPPYLHTDNYKNRRHLQQELATGANLTIYFPFLLLLIKMGMRVTEEALLLGGVLCCLVVLVSFPVAWPSYPNSSHHKLQV